MALQRKEYNKIPADAIILSEEEAFQYQSKLLSNWKISSDVFAYKYGAYFLGGATFIAGIYINNHLRLKLKLLNYGRMSTFLPVCVAPAALSAAFHQEFVLKNLALLKQEQCPVCLELRSSAIQANVGFTVPFLLSFVLNLSLVHKYHTVNVPYITQEPKKLLKFLLDRFRPAKNVFFGIFVGQALFGSIVTYFEANSVHQVSHKMYQQDLMHEAGST